MAFRLGDPFGNDAALLLGDPFAFPETSSVSAPAAIVSNAVIELTVDGLGTITSVTIAGVDVSASIANQSGGTLDVTVPLMWDHGLAPGTVSIVVGDGTDTADTTAQLLYPATIADAVVLAGLPVLSGTTSELAAEAAASTTELVLDDAIPWEASDNGLVDGHRFRVVSIATNTLTITPAVPDTIPAETEVALLSRFAPANYPVATDPESYPVDGEHYALRDPGSIYVADSLQADSTAEYSDPGSVFVRVRRDGEWTDEQEREAITAGPTITTQPTDESVTEPASASFTVAATGEGTLSYQWQVNTGSGWTDIAGETSTTLTIDPTSTELDGNQYRCSVTDDNGATPSSLATLTVAAVLDPPVFSGTIPNQEIEEGEAITPIDLSAFFEPAPTSYSQIAGTLPPGVSLNTSAGLISGTPTESGTFNDQQFRGTNDDGSDDTNTFNISVEAPPVVLFAARVRDLAATTATLAVSTNTAGGDLYFVVSTSKTKPTTAQMAAGQDHTGSAAAFASTESSPVVGENTASATGLDAEANSYWFHAAHEVDSEFSNVATRAFVVTRRAMPGASSGLVWIGR